MTAIYFKSESGDGYLEISQGESIEELTYRLADHFGDEWSFLEVVEINSTEHDWHKLRESISYTQ